MIKRYSKPEMKELWSEQTKLDTWLAVEIAICEALNKTGEIPDDALAEIKRRADFELERVKEIEKEVKHDVIAFLTGVAEKVGPASRFIHLGVTSSDILDTALAIQMRKAAVLIEDQLRELAYVLKKRAVELKYTVMVGRSHGIHAEPTTCGLKMALWYDETNRNLKRLRSAKEIISYGQISGAVGTFANIAPLVEEYVCGKFDLKPAPVSTQIIQRDRHAEFLTTLAIISSSLEKFATEIRNLQRTDILEVEEYFSPGQKGSSAMPHKRNPITCEQIAGLSRVVRGNAVAALENIALWHERDITHSSVERVIIPDSTTLVHYQLTRLNDVIKNLIIYPERMMSNLNKTGGLVFSQQVLMTLVKKGSSREDAYKMVQRNAHTAWLEGKDFRDLLKNDSDVKRYLSEEDINSCFDLDYHLKNVDYILGKAGVY